MTSPYFQLLRPRQYIKNLFLFLPAFFGKNLFDKEVLVHTVEAFFLFSLISSAVYIYNDICDIESDKNHPLKKERPVASGRIPVKTAAVIAVVLLISGGFGAFLLEKDFFLVVLTYSLMNLAYSKGLKNIPIVDVFIISLGFLLRIYAGSVVGDVILSRWIIIMTFLLALFLALAKRRDDLLIYRDKGRTTRKSISGYNFEFVHAAMLTMVPVIIVAYISYTTSTETLTWFHSENLYLTVFWVILGLMRYLQITFTEENSGNPTRILWQDRFIQFTMAGWIASFLFLIYY